MEFNHSDFTSRTHHQFAKELAQVEPNGSVRFYRLFEDFLTLAAIALRQGVHALRTGGLRDEKLEAEYMETVGQYDKERAVHFANAHALMVAALEEKHHDFLGSIYNSTGMHSAWHGQFFTPYPICQMMAKTVVGESNSKQKRLTVCEPAVGGGAMLIAVAEELTAQGFQPWNWWFEATDVDLKYFRMAYVQLTLLGAPGIVVHGNSLSGETWLRWPTLLGAAFPYRPPTEIHAEVTAPALPAPHVPAKLDEGTGQLHLL